MDSSDDSWLFSGSYEGLDPFDTPIADLDIFDDNFHQNGLDLLPPSHAHHHNITVGRQADSVSQQPANLATTFPDDHRVNPFSSSSSTVMAQQQQNFENGGHFIRGKFGTPLSRADKGIANQLVVAPAPIEQYSSHKSYLSQPPTSNPESHNSFAPFQPDILPVDQHGNLSRFEYHTAQANLSRSPVASDSREQPLGQDIYGSANTLIRLSASALMSHTVPTVPTVPQMEQPILSRAEIDLLVQATRPASFEIANQSSSARSESLPDTIHWPALPEMPDWTLLPDIPDDADLPISLQQYVAQSDAVVTHLSSLHEHSSYGATSSATSDHRSKTHSELESASPLRHVQTADTGELNTKKTAEYMPDLNEWGENAVVGANGENFAYRVDSASTQSSHPTGKVRPVSANAWQTHQTVGAEGSAPIHSNQYRHLQDVSQEPVAQQELRQEEVDSGMVTQNKLSERALKPNILKKGIASKITNKKTTKETKKGAHPYEGLTTPEAVLDKFHEICKSTKKGYETGAMEIKDGQLHTLELAGQDPVAARYLYDYICEFGQFGDMRKGSNGEAYSEEQLQASDPYLPNDFTAFLMSQSDWTKVRGNGRPDVLYQYKCTDDRVQYSPLKRRLHQEEVLQLEDGTILLSADGYPIRDFGNIPLTLCSKGMLAYQLVAIQRLNAAIGYPDFLDRMAPAVKQYKEGWVDGRMTKRAFNMAQVRVRNEMRINPWPETKGISQTVHQRAIEEELDEVDKAGNTTRNLVDLSDAKHKLFAILSNGKKFNRAGSRKLDDGKRLEGLKHDLKTLEALEDEEGSKMLKSAIKEQKEKIKQFEDGSLPNLEAKKPRTKKALTSTVREEATAGHSNEAITTPLAIASMGGFHAATGIQTPISPQQGSNTAVDQFFTNFGDEIFDSPIDFNVPITGPRPSPEKVGAQAVFARVAPAVSLARQQSAVHGSPHLTKRKSDSSDEVGGASPLQKKGRKSDGTSSSLARKRQRHESDGEPSMTEHLQKKSKRPGAGSFPNVPASLPAPGSIYSPASLYAASPLNAASFPSFPKKRKRNSAEDDESGLNPLQKRSKNNS